VQYREFHYRWEWQLRSSPDSLWPLVADTNRFNRDTGLPALELRGGAATTASARRRLRLSRFGIAVEWEEEPFEWIRPYRFGVRRRYLKGPLAEMRVLVELRPQPAGGTQLVYEIWARASSLFGLIAVPIQIGLISARSFDAAFRKYDRVLADGAKTPVELAIRASLASGGGERLAICRTRLLAQCPSTDLVKRLAETLEQADDLTLSRMRPYAFADYWGRPRGEVLELFLFATRTGMLDLRWDLLCPLCRGAKDSSSSLSGFRSHSHCDACNIDFNISLDRSVELTFRPNPAIRPTSGDDYCVGGPQVTPHIAVQQLLPARSERTLSPCLEAGRYRLRALGLEGGQFLRIAPEGLEETTLSVGNDGWPAGELLLAPNPRLRFLNSTELERLFILERTAWSDQAVTAAEVTALQLFRDLFANEALRPGEPISVGTLSIAFTDLRDSTRMYQQFGDAPAFGRVMNHFDLLREAIIRHEGALIKTIGDAVMCVFRTPVACLRAMLEAQQNLASPAEGHEPLALKAGIHHGPCIAVTLNDRLDYFGTTINLASRLERLSTGADVVVSAAVYSDPEVVQFLAQSNVTAEPVEAVLKGFERQRVELWRIARRKN
jgi:class 3 adenylate cyclase